MPFQVYPRRKFFDSDSEQVQGSELGTGDDVSTENHLPSNSNMLVVLRKKKRECNKYMLYLISNFVSFGKCLPSPKNLFEFKYVVYH